MLECLWWSVGCKICGNPVTIGALGKDRSRSKDTGVLVVFRELRWNSLTAGNNCRCCDAIILTQRGAWWTCVDNALKIYLRTNLYLNKTSFKLRRAKLMDGIFACMARRRIFVLLLTMCAVTLSASYSARISGWTAIFSQNQAKIFSLFSVT